MFKTEIAAIDKIDDLTFELARVANDLNDDACDLDTNLMDFLHNERMLEGDNVDWIFNDLVKNERDINRSLKKFDRILNQLIAERRKLGDFPISPE